MYICLCIYIYIYITLLSLIFFLGGRPPVPSQPSCASHHRRADALLSRLAPAQPRRPVPRPLGA